MFGKGVFVLWVWKRKGDWRKMEEDLEEGGW